jgi:thiosulfate/3-mercaptopyruvate sulfurtransferase
MLDNLGHERVALLDGGLKAWREAGLPVSTEPGDATPATLRLHETWRNTIDRDELRDRMGSATLIDARAAERYRGETEPVDPRAGHIPGAVNAPAKVALRPDGRFLPAEELAARLADVVPADRPVVASCGSGVTACHTALALRLAGRPDAILYAGSFSDWSRTDLPVATGPEAGSPQT